MNALISKSRRPKFELTFKLIDLNNVPLVAGISYVKWHIPSSTSAEHRGRTDKAPVTEHHVRWDYEHKLAVRLTMDKSNQLQECGINFEIIQVYGSARGDKITLGYINVNLAEYLSEGDDGEEGITRRYLMQDSKINSTLKICIGMKQLDGDKNWIAPPLKTASVFGGIAGIMGGEGGDSDENNFIPHANFYKSRETGELQDMYRRTLAASWLSQAGELPADECIEDIFGGGDGWRSGTYLHTSDEEHDDRRHRRHDRHRRHSGSPRLQADDHLTHDFKSKSSGSLPLLEARGYSRSAAPAGHARSHSGHSGHSVGAGQARRRSPAGPRHASSKSGSHPEKDGSSDHSEQERGRRSQPSGAELDEFAVQDDLRSWQQPRVL